MVSDKADEEVEGLAAGAKAEAVAASVVAKVSFMVVLCVKVCVFFILKKGVDDDFSLAFLLAS